MKRLRPWLVLTLIALALLLNGARSAIAQNLGPRQSLTQQGNNAANENQGRPKQTTASLQAQQSPTGHRGTDKSSENRNQHTSCPRKAWEWITGVSAQGFFNFIIAVATGLIAWFNFQLVGVTDEVKKATAEAAEAARQSARAAELALNAERPYLFIEDQKVGMYLHITPSLAMTELTPTPDGLLIQRNLKGKIKRTGLMCVWISN